MRLQGESSEVEKNGRGLIKRGGNEVLIKQNIF